MDLFFEDTNRDEELAATSSRTSKYNRKRCLLDKGTSSTSYSVKVAKVDKDESEDDSYYGGIKTFNDILGIFSYK